MSTALVLLVALIAAGAIVAVTEELKPVLMRRQDLAITRDPHLYSGAVVEVCVAGALMVREHDLDPTTAAMIAKTIREELEDGLVFDGHAFVDLSTIDSSYR